MGAIERDNGWGEVDPDSSDPGIKSAIDLAVSHGLVPSSGIPRVDHDATSLQLQQLKLQSPSAEQYVGELPVFNVLLANRIFK